MPYKHASSLTRRRPYLVLTIKTVYKALCRLGVASGLATVAIFAITIHPLNGLFKGQEFLVQGEVPGMQSLDGPQLKRSYMLHAAWQWAF